MDKEWPIEQVHVKIIKTTIHISQEIQGPKTFTVQDKFLQFPIILFKTN